MAKIEKMLNNVLDAIEDEGAGVEMEFEGARLSAADRVYLKDLKKLDKFVGQAVRLASKLRL